MWTYTLNCHPSLLNGVNAAAHFVTLYMIATELSQIFGCTEDCLVKCVCFVDKFKCEVNSHGQIISLLGTELWGGGGEVGHEHHQV